MCSPQGVNQSRYRGLTFSVVLFLGYLRTYLHSSKYLVILPPLLEHFPLFTPSCWLFPPPFSLLFISPSSPTLVLVAAALRAQGLWLGQKRTICKTDKLRTGSSYGWFLCVCMCVWRPALRRKGLKTKWRFWEPKTFLGYRQTRAKEESELQHRIYVIRDE